MAVLAPILISLTQLEIVVSFLILVSLPVKTVLKLPPDIVILV